MLGCRVAPCENIGPVFVDGSGFSRMRDGELRGNSGVATLAVRRQDFLYSYLYIHTDTQRYMYTHARVRVHMHIYMYVCVHYTLYF